MTMDTFSLYRAKTLELLALRKAPPPNENWEDDLLDELDVIWARMTWEERARTDSKGWLE